MQIAPRAIWYLVVAVLFWLVLLFGLLAVQLTEIGSSPFRSLAVGLFDFFGAFILLRLSHKLPQTLRLSVLGLGLALLFIGVGDANLVYSNFAGIPREQLLAWREPFYYAGSLLVLLSALNFPFAMQRQGLYPSAQAIGLVLGSLATSLTLTLILALATQTTLSFSIYLFVALLLTALFGGQTLILGTGRLAYTLRQLSIVFVLASLARVAAILLPDNPIGTVLYDLLWCAGLSFAGWMMATREN
jgi:uncharacterized membrane protein YczE